MNSQLLDIINGNISQARKPNTSRSPHPASWRGLQPQKSLTSTHAVHHTAQGTLHCLHTRSTTSPSGHSTPARKENSSQTPHMINIPPSKQCLLQMITKQGSKSLPVKIDPGA